MVHSDIMFCYSVALKAQIVFESVASKHEMRHMSIVRMFFLSSIAFISYDFECFPKG